MHNIRFAYGINRFDGNWTGKWPEGAFAPVAPIQTDFTTWDEYIDLLRGWSNISRHPNEKDKSTPWTAPFILGDDGEGRRLTNIVGMSAFAAFDLDTPGWSQERLQKALQGVQSLLYTTTQSRPHAQRWRILIPLTRECSVEEYGAVWSCMDDTFDHDLDHNTHNANRILYVPAKWQGADNLFIHTDGEPLSVDDVLAAGYEPIPVEQYEPAAELVHTGSVARPDGTDILTEKMVRDYTMSRRGGRFWKLLTSSAAWHRHNIWTLTAQELCDAAMAVNGTVKRENPLREAQRALAWANACVTPKTPLQRLTENHEYYLSRQLCRTR